MLSNLKPRPLNREDIEKRRRFFSKFIPRLRTPEETEKRRRFWRKARRRTGWTLAVLFVLHSGLNIYSSVLLNRELSAIREKGEPLQFAELAPPDVPDAQNAALVYAQATKSLNFPKEVEFAFNFGAPEQTPQAERDFEAALRANRKSLDLVRRAAAMPLCRFPLDYKTGNPTALLFPHYGEVRRLARLLSAQAQFEAKNGESDAALRDMRLVFGIAHHLSNEPILIGFLSSQAVDAIGHRSLARVLERVPLTLAEARAFETSLPATDWNRAFRHSFLGERAFSLSAFELIRQPDLQFMGYITGPMDGSEKEVDRSPSWIFYPFLVLWRPVLKLDEVHSLRLWKLQLDAASNPQKFAFSNSNQSFEKAIQNEPFYVILTRILMPSFSRATENRDGAEVRRRASEIALALAVYRTAKGHYPQKMKEVEAVWGKVLPLDPYSQKPFKYVQEQAGKDFRLYSVGVNRVDDGGRGPYHRDSNWKPGEDDLIWRGSLH